jgi:3-hydroxy-9,10-secoandrosta-1,3,5(10)-triene-9,17-dione monooxygenase
VQADGGWVIDGTWDYCSGAPYGNHFMPVCYVPGTERDGQPPELVYALVPASGWEMLDDWRGVLGMRGSGSQSIRVSETWVPEHFVVHDNLLDVDVSNATVGYRLHGNPMYAGRTLGFFHGELVAIAVGLGRAALDEYEHILRTRKTYVPPIVPRWQHHDFQRPFGMALGLVDAAESVVVRGAELYMEYCRRGVEGGEPFTVQEDYRLFTQAQHAMRMVWEAVETLFRTAGSTASKDGQPMQRYYRDLSMFRGHFSAQFENFAQMRTQAHFADAPAPGA